MKEAKRFGDLGFKFEDVSEWVDFKSLLDKEILVEDYLPVKGDFGDYVIFKFKTQDSNVLKASSTGAKVIREKFKIAKDGGLLPMWGKVVRKKNWYDII